MTLVVAMIKHLPLKNTALSVFLLLSMNVSIKAQKIKPVNENLYAEAEEYIFAGEYKEALPVYLNLFEKGFTTTNLNYKIGKCYLNLQGQKDKAIPYLERAVTKASTSYSGKDLGETNAPLSAYLYLGIAYRLNYEFARARNAFSSMLSQLDISDKQTRLLVEYNIRQCSNAEELIKSPSLIEKLRLDENINTPSANGNALVLSDEKTIFYMNQLKFYDALMQSVKINEQWQEPVNLTPEIKSDGDQWITGISADGNTLLLTAYDPYKCGEIYTCSFIDGKWTPIKKLNNNINSQFNETHASFSSDGKTLYFTSDRKGGYGRLDLYKSELVNDDWGPAVNLGPVINTIFDEETPFITADGRKLFFSSQGHYNMGGYDIFYSELRDNTWLPPLNIGYPLNTPDDNLFYFPIDTGQIAYMSVIDKESRESDIYRFAMHKYANPVRYTVVGKVDLQTDQKIDIADITVTFIEKENKDTVATQPLDEEGKFKQKLPQGYYTIYFNDTKGNPLDSKEINIPPFFAQDQLVFNTRISETGNARIDTFNVEDILFSFDKSAIPEQSREFLNSLIEFMLQNPDILLQITGHTDALGSEDYNLKLSQNRAMGVANYLKNKQINSSRFAIKAMGESEPVVSNTLSDGSDNPEGRKYNRRVEIQISMLPENWVISHY
jgi:outer membrane protein OmpA-like peptidoglycan-associated protein/tetratricopeptide (TPR) repeat protein